jgi:hypothetical protein
MTPLALFVEMCMTWIGPVRGVAVAPRLAGDQRAARV